MEFSQIQESPVLAVDTEGNAKDYRHDPKAKTMGISCAWRSADHRKGVSSDYWPFFHTLGENRSPKDLELLGEEIEAHPVLIFHNAKYDILALENLGINVRHKRFYDTMLMGHFLNENMLSKGLDAMSRLYGGYPKERPDLMKQVIKTFGWEFVPSHIMAEYSAHDAFITYQLFEKLLPDFIEEGYDGELWELECDFMRLIIKMESYGVAVDPEVCQSEIEYGEARMQEIVRHLNGLNPSSPVDLEYLLIDTLGLEAHHRTDTGRPSFDKEAMAFYDEELSYRDDKTANFVLEYRGWQKAVSAYYSAYLRLQSHDGNIHPSFKLHGTRTGRLSCEKPNLQQIPRSGSKRWNANSKLALRARPGYTLWEVDYSNLEFRLGALYANEPNMIKPLQNGFKPFDSMAELIYGPNWTETHRQGVKVFTYMTAYGAGIEKIHRIMKQDLSWAQKMRDDWYGAYPGMRTATKRAQKLADARGYALLWTGRRRHFEDGRGAHKAFNAVIQGGAAELVKRTMLLLDRVLDWDECKMLLQVHDSVVFEIRNGTEALWLPLIKVLMESPGQLHPKFATVPFPVEIKRWGTEEKWKLSG